MKKFPNIRKQLKKLEEKSKELHDTVFQAFKESVGEGSDYSAQLSGGFIYSIACGQIRLGFHTHLLLYMDGEINLYRMSFENIDRLIASWKNIETFKKEIAGYLKK